MIGQKLQGVKSGLFINNIINFKWETAFLGIIITISAIFTYITITIII